jgi:hypothetical protein
MDQILLYDIGDGEESRTPVSPMSANPSWQAEWRSQTATGQVPEMRRKSCGGAIWPTDQSSYNV